MEEADREWQSALRDKAVQKGRDEYGNITVAKLATATVSSGRSVNSVRSLQEERTHEVAASSDVAAMGRGGPRKTERLRS